MHEVKSKLLVGKKVKYKGDLLLNYKHYFERRTIISDLEFSKKIKDVEFEIIDHRMVYLDFKISKKKKIREEFEQIMISNKNTVFNHNWYSLKDFIILD